MNRTANSRTMKNVTCLACAVVFMVSLLCTNEGNPVHESEDGKKLYLTMVKWPNYCQQYSYDSEYRLKTVVLYDSFYVDKNDVVYPDSTELSYNNEGLLYRETRKFPTIYNIPGQEIVEYAYKDG